MKKYLSSNFAFLGVFVLLLLLSACKKEEQNNIVYLNLDHNVAGKKLELNDTWYNCAAGHKFNVIRLKYYLSNFTFHKSDGTSFQTKLVHYRDIENSATKTISIGNVPNGEYTSMSFIFGLDEATNVRGGIPNTLTNINMEWPLPGDKGYHYMKFEGWYNVQGGGTIKSFNLHTGATGGNQNFINISLPFQQAVKMEGKAWNVNLLMDMNEWLQNPIVYDFEIFGSMIMSNQNAQAVLKSNGATAFSISSVTAN